MKQLTVVRWPNGSWSTGGPVSDPDYQQCEVYVVPFTTEGSAKKRAQAVRRRLVSKELPLTRAASKFHTCAGEHGVRNQRQANDCPGRCCGTTNLRKN